MKNKEILRSPGDPQPAECVLHCVAPLYKDFIDKATHSSTLMEVRRWMSAIVRVARATPLQELQEIWANYYWAIITHLKGFWKVFIRASR